MEISMVWITRFANTQGVKEIKGSISPTGCVIIDGPSGKKIYERMGKTAFLNKKDAKAAALKKARAKRKSLLAQIKILEEL